LDLPSASGRKVFEFHPRLHTRKSVSAVVQCVLPRCHEGEEVISRFLFLGETRNDAVPGPAVGVTNRVKVELVPLALHRIIRLSCSRDNCRANLALHLRLLWILGKSWKIAPGWFHDCMPGQEQAPTLSQRPTDRFFRPAREKLHVIF